MPRVCVRLSAYHTRVTSSIPNSITPGHDEFAHLPFLAVSSTIAMLTLDLG
jgi:hypothetical protein